MLIDFFYTLRAAKLPVSVKEFLALLEALDAGVIGPKSEDRWSLDDFYHLGRTILVKDEKHFDKYDRAFSGIRAKENANVRHVTLLSGRGLKHQLSPGVLRRLCQVYLHHRGPGLPHNDRPFALLPPTAGPSGPQQRKNSAIFRCRINVSSGRFDKGARFAWLSGCE